MSKKKTILIFGISSFVGSALAESLKDKYKIVGTYFNTPVTIPGVFTMKCDVLEKEIVQRIIYLHKPDITIYAVGLTDLMVCQEFPKLADALNTAGIFSVAQASERYNSKLIYLSSNYIFSGEDLLHKENDTPTPLNVYGKTKASTEFYIQKSCLNYIVFRCAPIFGHGINKNDPSFIENLERGEFLKTKMDCDTRIRTGFIDIETLAQVIDKAIEKEITNILLQVSSSDTLTHFEFAKMYFEKISANTGLITPSEWPFPLSLNQNSSASAQSELYFKMDTSNLTVELGITPPSVSEMIDSYLVRMGSVQKKKLSS